jgi:hypothetical protein
MPRDRRTKDQKRQAKLKDRERRRPQRAPGLAYSGAEYRKPRWVPLVFATEVAVYETLVMSDHELTNTQAQSAFTDLVFALRAGKPPVLSPDEPDAGYGAAGWAAILIWNIRRAWTDHFDRHGPVHREHLIGVLRTLLYSIEAHASRSRGGYLGFIERFLTSRGVRVQKLSPEEIDSKSVVADVPNGPSEPEEAQPASPPCRRNRTHDWPGISSPWSATAPA